MARRDSSGVGESAPGSSDAGEPAAPSTGDWEYDAEILRTLAAFSGVTPLALLRKVSWSVGERPDTAPFRRGQPLSPAVRDRLRSMLKERLRIEYEIIGHCRHASSQIVRLLPCFIGLAVVSVLFI